MVRTKSGKLLKVDVDKSNITDVLDALNRDR